MRQMIGQRWCRWIWEPLPNALGRSQTRDIWLLTRKLPTRPTHRDYLMTLSPSSFLFIATLTTLAAFLRQRTHFLTALLAIEAALLLLATAVPMNQIVRHLPNTTLLILILTIAACEARLGLALLVLIVRSYGNDLIRSLTANKL